MECIEMDSIECSNCEIPPWIKKEMIFPRKSITFKEELGRGNFGVVRKARVRVGISEFPVALKSTKHVRNNDTDIPRPDRKDVEALMEEAKSMLTVGKYNENIVNLQGVCFDMPDGRNLENFYIILEYCANGNLKSYLCKHENEFEHSLELWHNNFHESMPTSKIEDGYNYDTENPYVILNHTDQDINSKSEDGNNNDAVQLIIWSYQIASGMEFLSSRAIYHGDLACRNILLTENLVAKISDFGLSRRLYDKLSSDVKSDDDLPFRWSAIEVLNIQKYSLQSDIWSFGIVLWEIFQLGREPYLIEGLDIPTLRNMLTDGVRPAIPVYAPSHISDHMQQCWNEKPKERPCYTSFLHTLQNVYGLKASSELEVTPDNIIAYLVTSRYLKYASLAFDEESVESRYRRLQNLRVNQDFSEEQMSDEKTEYTTIEEARTEALQSAKLLVRNGCDEIINDSNIEVDNVEVEINHSNAGAKADNYNSMSFSGKIKLICVVAIAMMFITTIAIVLPTLHGTKAINSTKINEETNPSNFSTSASTEPTTKLHNTTETTTFNGIELNKDALDQCRTEEGTLQGLKNILREIDDPQEKSDVMNSKDEYGKSVLYWCIQNEKLETAQYLIGEKVDVNSKTNTDGMTPIILASAKGYLALVQQLINKGAQIDAKRNDNYDAAYAAAQQGHLSILQILIENSPNVSDRQGFKGRTLLGAAAYNGHLEVVEYLVTQVHVQINIMDENGHTPLKLVEFKNLQCLFRTSPKCSSYEKIVAFLTQNGATF